MADEKKFLDQAGVQYLWSQLSLEDYPNNETLIAVLNAIDTTKADKDDIVQSDWSQNDSTALDYVKNRTHWINHAETLLDSEVFECTTLASDSESYYCAKSGNIGLVSGNKYNVTVNGTTYTAVPALNAFGTNDVSLLADIKTCRIYDRENGTVEVFSDTSITLTISIVDAEDVYVKLDERFIPDVFAHLEDVELKMDKENPTGSGALSINRASGSEIGENSVAIGNNCIASGASAIAIGSGASATGFASHAEGNGSVASGDLAHAEGQDSKATGYASHAESSGEANGDYSHAEGYGIADGNYSHASGNGTWAVGRSQTVIGEANYEDEAEDSATRGTYAVIVGNGDIDAGEYSNASTLDWAGNAWFAGDVYVGSTEGFNKDEGSQKLATEEYVNSKAEDSVKKYFLIIETVREGANYLLDGITFDEINEKFNAGNVNMVCHVDGTDYIPLLSVTSSSIIFSGIYNTTSVSLVFNSEGVGTLTSTYLAADSKFSSYYTKTETNTQIANLVNSAPETLDTLGELAAAFQENKEVVDVLNEAITNKYSADNPPPYPVTSVQGKTGDVVFTTETWTFTLADGTVITK